MCLFYFWWIFLPIYFVCYVSFEMNRTCPCWKREACPVHGSLLSVLSSQGSASGGTMCTTKRVYFGPRAMLWLEASTEGRMAKQLGQFWRIMISQLRRQCDDYPIKAVTIGQLAGKQCSLKTQVQGAAKLLSLSLVRAGIKLTDFIATLRVKFLLLKSVRIGQQMCAALSLNSGCTLAG